MALTVRTTEEDEKIINAVKKQLEIKSSAKAMLQACEMYPLHVKRIKDLETKLKKAENDFQELTELLQQRNSVNSRIEQIVGN